MLRFHTATLVMTALQTIKTTITRTNPSQRNSSTQPGQLERTEHRIAQDLEKIQHDRFMDVVV
jgi:hypothetical protein